ncbi:MAG: tetratricopeptide repeat protein, partial [Cyanobacteria bacterium J06641_2]
VFNGEWVDKQLGNLRPYSESFHAWVVAEFDDESRLLRGKALQEAQIWAENKSLSDLDYQFLAASQELEKRTIQLELETTQKANQILSKAQTKARRLVRFGFVTMALTVFLGFFTVPIVMTRLPIILNSQGLKIYVNERANCQNKRINRALEKYNLALMLKPGYPQALYNKGLLFQCQGDINNARVQYEAAMFRGFPKAYNNLARLYILDKKYSRAIDLLEAGLKLNKRPRTKLTMLKNLGWAKFKQKHYTEAEKYLRASIAELTNNENNLVYYL